MAKSRYNSSSNEKKIQAYLKPRIYMMFKAEQVSFISTESGHANKILAKYYEGLSKQHQEELLTEYKRLEKLKE